MLNYIPHDGLREDRADGSILLRSRVPLGPVARNTGEWLHDWAQKAPDRVFVAELSGHGWRELRYAELLSRCERSLSSLLARGLGPEKPIVVISGNASITRFWRWPGHMSACLSSRWPSSIRSFPTPIHACDTPSRRSVPRWCLRRTQLLMARPWRSTS